jgi:hypothetical protein
MIITVFMKTPDCLEDPVRSAVAQTLSMKLDADEWEEQSSEKEAEVKEKLKQWFKYGEELTIQFDTDLNTATVMKQRD